MSKLYVVFVSCLANDLTIPGDHKLYVESVLFNAYHGPHFFFTEKLDQALLMALENASSLASILRYDCPTACFEEVSGDE